MGDGRKEDNVDGNGNPPVLLEAVNKNGLALFLIVGLPPLNCNSILLNLEFFGGTQANLATGVINLTLPTMYMSNILAMLVLNGYAMAICGIAWVWKDKRILRF